MQAVTMLRHWTIWVQMVTGQVEWIGSGVCEVRSRYVIWGMMAAMTLTMGFSDGFLEECMVKVHEAGHEEG